MRKLFVLLALLVALVCTPAAAQEEPPGPITWIGLSKVQPGKTEAAVQMELKDKAFMDGMLADGTILSWGVATQINHFADDDANHVQWVTVANWEKIGDWFGAVMGLFQSLGAEEMAAREAAGKEIYVEGSHYDQVVRHLVFDQPADGNAQPQFIYFGRFNAKPGQGEGIVNLFKEFVVPTLNELQDSGDMGAFGLYTPELHDDSAWSHTAWYVLPDLAAVDTMQAAFRSKGGPAVNAWAESVFDLESHEDQIYLILHIGLPEGN